jgi:hypothetical protein
MYIPLVRHSVGIDQKNLSKILFLESLIFANKVSLDSFEQSIQMFCTIGGPPSPSWLTEFSLNAGGLAC